MSRERTKDGIKPDSADRGAGSSPRASVRPSRVRPERCAVALILVIIFSLTVYRALTTNITDDEASTYIFYALPYRMFSWTYLKHMYTTCIANNHWLNTALIHLADLASPAGYSEAAVRMPNLAAFAAYLAAAYLGWRRGRFPLPVLAFLVSNYYLNEFYGLGRGYGLAHTFLFLSLLCFMEYRACGGDRYLVLMLFFLSLSSMSNTVVLLAYPAVGAAALSEMAARRELKAYFRHHVLSTAAFAAFTALMAGYHLGVSSRDRALYTGTGDFFHSVVLTYVRMLVTSKAAQAAALAALLLLTVLSAAAFLHNKKAGRNSVPVLFLTLVIFALTIILSGKLFSMGYITGRAALPFWSLAVLGFGDLFSAGTRSAEEILRKRNKGTEEDREKALSAVFSAGGLVLAAAAVLLFVRKIDLTSTEDWPWDYGTRERVAAVYEKYGRYPEDEPVQDYADVFYINKYAPLYGADEYPAKLYTDE